MDDKQRYIYACIAFLLILFGLFFYFNDSSVKNIEISQSTGAVTFSDTELVQNKWEKWYSYYQMYVYPKKYTLLCEWEKETCNVLDRNSYALKNHSLYFMWKKIDSKESSDVILPIDFSDKNTHAGIIQNIFIDLFSWESNQKIIANKWDRNNWTDSANVENMSHMQQLCREQIEQSVPTGTFERESTIEQKTIEECSGMEHIDTVQLAFGWINEWDESVVSLKLSIEELRLEYRFFSLKNGEYELESSETKDIERVVNISGDIDLSKLGQR